MVNNNTTSLMGFIKDYVCWQMVIIMLHKSLLFKGIDGMTVSSCLNFMWVLILASVVISAFTVTRYNRNFTNVFVGTLMPLEIYTFITYFQYFKIKVTVILVTIAVFMILYGLLMFTGRISNRANLRRVIFSRVTNYLYCSRVVAVVLMSVFVIPLAIDSATGGIYLAKTVPVGADEGNEYTIENNIETVCKLREEEWEKLGFDDRMEVLQVVANIEANYLGIPMGLSVVANNMNNTLLGNYNDEKHKITVNIQHLKNSPPREILKTVCHEVYHSYERRLTDLYAKLSEEDKRLLLFADAEDYTTEFANYKRTGRAYYEQSVERDSRKYSEAAVYEYYKHIEEYLDKEKTTE